ncbi:MAG TPA: CatB-related O-acetyltransferase [Candidatus Dormibacteraeota bacterium]
MQRERERIRGALGLSPLAKVLKGLAYSVPERRWSIRRYAQERDTYETEPLSRGRYSYGTPLITRHPLGSEHVRIGSFVSIAPEVVLQDGGSHRTDWVTAFPLRACLGLPGAYEDGHPRSRGDTLIGNDVWIGRGACVLSGITIADGAAVAAFSVITKDVPPYTIVGGNPAREIRKRFSEEQIDALLQIAWWDWPLEKIVECVEELSDPDVDRFIARHGAV